MNVSVVRQLLSDGSAVYNVVFVDGSYRIVVACDDEISAYNLQTAFKLNALSATVY